MDNKANPQGLKTEIKPAEKVIPNLMIFDTSKKTLDVEADALKPKNNILFMIFCSKKTAKRIDVIIVIKTGII
tara:strand:+ start:1625 stop:1843 length:219 start_codon:yes stop_codon:yes gene_type:complete